MPRIKDRNNREIINIYVPKIDKSKTFYNILKILYTPACIGLIYQFITTEISIGIIIYNILIGIYIYLMPRSCAFVMYVILFPFCCIYLLIKKIRSKFSDKQSNNESRD